MTESSRTTNMQTILHLIKGNIGPGCLALPFCFSLLGPIYSLPTILLIAITCIYNMWLLVECKRRLHGPRTYGELALAVYGKNGQCFVESCLCFMQLSICCVYISFISNNILSIVCNSSNETTSNNNNNSYCSITQLRIIMCVLVIPIVILIINLRTIRSLTVLSFISFILVSIGMCTIIGFCITIMLYNDNHSISNIHTNTTNTPSSNHFWLFISAGVYAFEGIGIILPIENAMQYPRAFTRCFTIAMIIVSIYNV